MRMINRERKRRGIEGRFVPPRLGDEEGRGTELSSEESEEEEEDRSDVERGDGRNCDQRELGVDSDEVGEVDRSGEDHEGKGKRLEAGEVEVIPPCDTSSPSPHSSTLFGPGGQDIRAHCSALTAALNSQKTVPTTLATAATASIYTHAQVPSDDADDSTLTDLTNTSASSSVSSASSEDEEDGRPITSARSGVYQGQKSKDAKPSLKRFAKSRDGADTEDTSAAAAASTSAPPPKQRGRLKKAMPEPPAVSESISAPVPAIAKKTRGRPPKKREQDSKEAAGVDEEADAPPPKPKKKGKARSKKGIILSEAEEDPVHLDEGHDDSNPPATSVVPEPVLNSMPESAANPALAPDILSTGATDTGPTKKSVKLSKGRKSEKVKPSTGKEWEFVPSKNIVGAGVDSANIIDSASGKRMTRRSKTTDAVPVDVLGKLWFFSVDVDFLLGRMSTDFWYCVCREQTRHSRTSRARHNSARHIVCSACLCRCCA